MKNFFKENKILTVILLGSFLASLIYSFYFQIKPVVDARAYDTTAQNIVNGIGFRENPEKDILHDYAIARVGPLYQYFLAGLYFVFGHNLGIVWLFQSLLHMLSAWLVYLIARQLFDDSTYSKTIALIAAGFLGFYPDLIEISAMLMTETLYLFLFCLTLYIFFRFFERDDKFSVALLGLVFGLAVLARPPVLLILPLFIFYFFRRKEFMKIAILILMLILVFVPWTARNYLTYSKIMPFGAAGNFNFWIGNYHGGGGEQEPIKVHYDFVATRPVAEINGESMRQFISFLRNYPAEFIKLTFLRVNKYFSLIRPMGFWFYQYGLGQAIFIFSSALASVFLFIFALGGFWESIKQKDEKLLYLAAFTVLTPLLIFITVVETRYRFQIYPLLAIFSAFFAVKLFSSKNWWTNKILWSTFIFLFFNTLIDLFLSLEKLKERFSQFL